MQQPGIESQLIRPTPGNGSESEPDPNRPLSHPIEEADDRENNPHESRNPAACQPRVPQNQGRVLVTRRTKHQRYRDDEWHVVEEVSGGNRQHGGTRKFGELAQRGGDDVRRAESIRSFPCRRVIHLTPHLDLSCDR